MRGVQQMSYVGLGVPWVAFGASRLFADSGFLDVYDALCAIYRQTGNKSLLYLDCLYRDVFNAGNDPEVTGVYPIYSRSERNQFYARTRTIDDAAAGKIFMGYAPVDYVVTTSNCIVSHIAAQGIFGKFTGVPVIYICLNAGEDGFSNPLRKVRKTRDDVHINSGLIFPLYMEAMAYMSASYVVWTTTDQKKRGMSIAKNFLVPSEMVRLYHRNSVIGHGISDLLRPYRISDDEVKRKLQAKKADFKVTFLGRITRNKNIGFICDTVKNLYAMHGTELELNLFVSKAVQAAKISAAGDDVFNFISDKRFGREYASRERYASELLPETQCLMYASLAEGYCITPREAVYIGVPAIVPRVPWAVTAFGPDYPFYYVGKEEAFALIRRIEEGAVTDEEAARFLSVRDNGYACEFVSQTSMKLFSVFRMLAEDMRQAYAKYSYSKIMDCFEKNFDIGDEFTMQMVEAAANSAGLSTTNKANRRAMNLFEFYVLLSARLECVNPFQGKFRRVT
jgi:hypothetical protein